ncbi:hypothetical protein BFP75_11005 [Maribacter sp. 4G9]|nr:hypothetical protein BFP75_11005 [Maribacter sp. 4G9]
MSNQRSGSTLIENILSKSTEIISVGETYLLGGYLHKKGPGSAWDWNCSCGSNLNDCDFWKKIFNRLKLKDLEVIKNTKIIYPKGPDKELIKEENKHVATLMNNIYNAVFDITHCSILVDSSKEAYHGISLYRNSQFNFKFIYLKRDLRAVSISRQKWRRKYDKENLSLLKLLLANYIHRINCWFLLRSVKKKDIYNLNYEDFFKNPQEIFNDMSEFIGFNSFSVPDYMELNDDHTIAGTPNRFEKRKIKYDDGWHDVAKKNPFFNFLGYILNKIG